MSRCTGKGAILIGNRLAVMSPGDARAAAERAKVVQVERNLPLHKGDSGYVCYLDTTPTDRTPDADDGVLACLHCLIDQHPEAGGGLELAKLHPKGVVFVDGAWHPMTPTNGDTDGAAAQTEDPD